ncbi:MAG: protein-L-isoaspartate(D-aspartate) O-methyltransferase [Amphritea sp.]
MMDSQQLIDEISREAQFTGDLTGRYRFSDTVMQALKTVPRECFVADNSMRNAYLNVPLPIGYGQTISQPYIVALMTDLLDPDSDKTYLEVGTGSGYQAAILASLVKQVYSIEVIAALHHSAAELLHRLGYDNVHCILGDGNLGYPQCAPYDGIIVTACARKIPAALIEQLNLGGRMIIPVGTPGSRQTLYLIEKSINGKTSSTPVLGVAFVPLVEP